MSFEAEIADFARALVDPGLPPPQGDARRFGIYRNNVAVGLIGTLKARFPVTRRLVGDDFFRAMAGAFVAACKPRTAVLIYYGGDFPAFVRDFEPAREFRYLPEVAALESAWVEAYHAPEALPLAMSAIGEVAPEELQGLRFVLHPAARLLGFASPAASLWAAHQGESEPEPPASWGPEDVLVTRPHAEVLVRALPPGGYDFLAALRDGATLGHAAAPLVAVGGDPGTHLVGLIEAGAFSSFL